MYRLRTLVILSFAALTQLMAQPRFSQPHGLYDVANLTVTVEGNDPNAAIHYTTDGSVPTPQSTRYTGPLTLTGNTLLRAVEVTGDKVSSAVATASYLFVDAILAQPNNPEGYPAEWGSFTQIHGTAPADYEMDPEMTGDPVLRPKIIEGLKSLPVLSIVTDKDNLFSHENDPDRGGIYIFTGPPVGDATGHGWTRPVSVELMGGPQQHNLTVSCGLRLHGGHGRLAEKNPKHSLRLVFKKEYGPGSLKYSVFGKDGPDKFNQLVLRCHFGNAWQHWDEGNRQKAQYTRDVWMRRMQRRMGHTGVDALYVHLFLNGMYWGLYNMAERVDDQYGKDYLGGSKADIDVIKLEEDGGYHIEAAEGDLDAWQLMTQTAARAADDSSYEQLDSLLDIDNFIDYMLINQYAGNTDWAHHNWYAIRRKGSDSQGFRFLCWDSELIFGSEGENVLSKNDGTESPTGIFTALMGNERFARRYLKRAKELLADDGPLGQQNVVEVWDSLYNTIATALYCEAARWGDYRRDVHRYSSGGQLYTVDNQYQNERQRLLTQYFPVRTERVLNSIIGFVNLDDFEMPDDWTPFTASMFHEWNGTGADAQPTDKPTHADWNLNTAVGSGGVVAGFVGVEEYRFADLSSYGSLVLRGTGGGLRILANRLVPHGPWKQIVVSFNSSDPYWDEKLGAVVVPLKDLATMNTTNNEQRVDDFVHLNALKVDWNNTATVRGIYLTPGQGSSAVATLRHDDDADGRCYSLSGQQVGKPRKGIYVRNGRKVVVK